MKQKREYDQPQMQVVKLREIPQLLQMSGREQYEAEDENPFGNESDEPLKRHDYEEAIPYSDSSPARGGRTAHNGLYERRYSH